MVSTAHEKAETGVYHEKLLRLPYACALRASALSAIAAASIGNIEFLFYHAARPLVCQGRFGAWPVLRDDWVTAVVAAPRTHAHAAQNQAPKSRRIGKLDRTKPSFCQHTSCPRAGATVKCGVGSSSTVVGSQYCSTPPGTPADTPRV
eukprot:2751089-Rhodomonas_salina.1